MGLWAMCIRGWGSSGVMMIRRCWRSEGHHTKNGCPMVTLSCTLTGVTGQTPKWERGGCSLGLLSSWILAQSLEV